MDYKCFKTLSRIFQFYLYNLCYPEITNIMLKQRVNLKQVQALITVLI